MTTFAWSALSSRTIFGSSGTAVDFIHRADVPLSVPALQTPTLNTAGYRYGASDQAFYVPAVLQHLNPALFPRDRALLSAQDRLMVFDEIAAGVARLTGVPGALHLEPALESPRELIEQDRVVLDDQDRSRRA